MNPLQHIEQSLYQTRRGLVFVLTLATLLKASILIFDLHAGVNNDGKLYISAAQHLSVGHLAEALTLYPMPAYPTLIVYVHYLIPDWILAARLISVVCSILVLIPFYLLTEDLFNRRAAFYASLVFTLSPEMVRFTTMILRDHPYTLSFISAVYFAQRAIRTKRSSYLVAAVAFSCLSLLFRLEGAVIFVATLVFLAALTICKGEDRRDYLRLLVVWTSLFGLFLVCLMLLGLDKSGTYRYHEYTRYIKPLVDPSYGDNVQQIRSQLKAIERASPHPEWSQNFAEIASRFIALIYLLGILYDFVRVLFVANIVPLWLGVGRSRWTRTHVFVTVLTFSYVLMCYHFLIVRDFFDTRFLIVPVILVFPWVGAGLDKVLGWTRGLPRGALVTAGVIAVLLGASYSKFNHLLRPGRDIDVEAGKWLAMQPDLQNSRFVLTDANIEFYRNAHRSDGEARTTVLFPANVDADVRGLEKVVESECADVVVVKVKGEKGGAAGDLRRFEKVREFCGRDGSVIVYRRVVSCLSGRLPSSVEGGRATR
jgi:hypothetical protein